VDLQERWSKDSPAGFVFGRSQELALLPEDSFPIRCRLEQHSVALQVQKSIQTHLQIDQYLPSSPLASSHFSTAQITFTTLPHPAPNA
jgi:hypothetical protein